MLMVVATMAATFLGTTVAGAERNADRTDRFEARRSGTSVNRLTAQSVWDGYSLSLAGGETSILSLRAYLDSQGLTDQSTAADPLRTERLGTLGLPQNDDGEYVLGTTEILSVLVHRIDKARETQLVVTTEGREKRGYASASTNAVEEMTEVFSLEPGPFDGLGFALLANNINCIMCHTTVDDVRRVYASAVPGDDEYVLGVRVGSIESLELRNNPVSGIAGTLFVGGEATNRDGSDITDWATRNLLGGAYGEGGGIELDAFGAAEYAPLNPSNPDLPAESQNLYTDYLDGREQIGGALPDSFPFPFPDNGGLDASSTGAGNRLVDDEEFAAATSFFNGGILGGAIGVVPIGDEVSTSAAAALLAEGNESTLGAVTNANVVLTGTDDQPIQIDGDVAIDGDLIISGPIQGRGALWVRGNVYVRGDLTYADGMFGEERNFGISSNGQVNAFGLTAGGSIVIGDPYAERNDRGGIVDGGPSGAWNFIMMEIASFNRREWIKTQAELPGQAVGGTAPLHPNPEYLGDDYLARYYAFSEGDVVPIQNKEGYFEPSSGQWISDEHANSWDLDELTLADPTDASDPTLYPATRPAPVVETLMPTADWIQDDVLMGLIRSNLAERDSNAAFKVDAALYSANSIFGVIPDQQSAGTNGELRIQGSVIASDLGLLGPRGTEIFYDERSQQVLDIRDESEITMRLLGALPTVNY